MLIAGFPAGSWGTNCYVVATEPGTECVIVDPGQDSADAIASIVREQALKPVAIVLTHGHIDHMFSVTPVAGAYDATAYIHPADRHLLTDPTMGMGSNPNWTFVEPDDVRLLDDGMDLELAGLTFTVDHAPGHTEGSVAFRAPYDEAAGISQVMFSGDLLFAGSIGRTDLPGGDHQKMLDSLRAKVLTLPDDVVVLPGHGEQTSIGHERATNPFLRRLTAHEAGFGTSLHEGSTTYDAPTRGL